MVTVGAQASHIAAGDGSKRKPNGAGTEGVAAPAAHGEASGLEVSGLTVTLPGGRQLIDQVSFTAARGSLTAIIGPSGAGKSTLARAICGITSPTAGSVMFEGRDVLTDYAQLRQRIGLVPQEDVVHRQLTLRRALNYAAELRLADDTPAGRSDAVASALRQLELTDYIDTRIDKLSGGQRKRASVALELLTSPSLLILDEPTSGLDPGLDRQVMSTLRVLADAGRIVIVVTHCLAYLDYCDQVLLLAPGGKPAFVGPPQEIASVMGTSNWADIYDSIGADPDAAYRKFVARCAPLPEARGPALVARCAYRNPKSGFLHQVSTLIRRQARLIAADRGYLLFLTLLPFILGAVTLVVPGDTGFDVAPAHGSAPNEPAQLLVILNISAVFMGSAITVRDLVGERMIYRREQLAGLSASAYVTAKLAVYGIACLLQTAALTAVVVLGKGSPTQGAVLLPNATVELYITLAATAVVAAMTGLAMSSTAKSQDQILPMLVISVMFSIVFSGGLIPVTDRHLLDELSLLLPARWGFAASASTVDLREIAPLLSLHDPLWAHSADVWLSNLAALALLGLILSGYTRWRVRLATTRS